MSKSDRNTGKRVVILGRFASQLGRLEPLVEVGFDALAHVIELLAGGYYTPKDRAYSYWTFRLLREAGGQFTRDDVLIWFRRDRRVHSGVERMARLVDARRVPVPHCPFRVDIVSRWQEAAARTAV